MRAGIFVPQGWRHDLVGIDPAEQWQTMHSLAARADANPLWESIWVNDHFHTVPVPSDQATHEAWTLMAAFAASTSRVRLGQMCTCIQYREPTYLAKVATTVDIVSGGRVEMGIGAGWYEHEWRAYGYGFPQAPERLVALREGVEIMHQAWTTGTATFHGTRYDVDGALFYPQPLQKPGIPFWIAGGGEKVTLKIAAKYASYTNFDGSPEGFAAKSVILRAHCDALGTDFDAIVRSANYNVLVVEKESDLDAARQRLDARVRPYLGDRADGFVAEYRPERSLAVGTPAQIVDRLQRMQELGLGYGIFYFPNAAYDTTEIELFEREVLPQLS
ncbi:LLM class F420-dependent oxidoreductase [Gryllotalpicola sp.]|uniref:LLM class F420-dependent oxidoreductase n=1 Tax=Gryllotalpicola sp. TaxID=1932787 RepID=UPI0026171A2E|nr:LLM class F420-dependent oxidoreductase [Gryllotalpicola sp.]